MTSKDRSKEDNSQSQSGMCNVLMLDLVRFFIDFSTEMILGILPLFIVNNLGASRAILGAIEGSAELTSYAFRMVSGALSDKIKKRKLFVLIGYGLSTVSKPFFIITTAWSDAFVVRMVDRIGKGVRTVPGDALIADSVTESISGKASGVYITIDQMGVIVGLLTAFAILKYLHDNGFNVLSMADLTFDPTDKDLEIKGYPNLKNC